MSFIDTFGPHVPYLRRFSRALTGSQAKGDVFVGKTLEALSLEEHATVNELSAKTKLYKILLGIWSSAGAHLEPDLNINEAERKTYKLTPLARQAFLLQSLEGMSLKEITDILDINVDEVKRLIAQVDVEIENELRTNVLIIEDEAFIAADIEDLVSELGHSVDAIVATHKAALEAVSLKTPGLILADVQLADGSSGIDAAHEILASVSVPVIFITAFPERLLTGDRPEPAYLISKPFEQSNVKAAISQALYFHQP